MCIIVYKPQNATPPTKKILKNCFVNNPDGAGFMYVENNQVIIKKGFFNFNKFYKALREVPKDAAVVYHFRISTQAGKRTDCCHPYPLSDNMQDLRKLETTCEVGIAHNGIIALTTNYYTKTITYNDTMKFITDYLSLIIDSKDYYKDAKKLKLIERLSESKLAILDNDNHCELIGSEWIKDNNIYYSNSSYLSYKIIKKKQSKKPDFDYLNYEEDWFEYEDEYSGLIDKKTGLYNFDSINCPLAVEGDCSYCISCNNYEECNKKGII